MRVYALAAAAVILTAALLSLVGLQWKHELGSFADSPQELEVPLGTRRIAAGGRALIGAIAAAADDDDENNRGPEADERFTVELLCRGERQRIELERYVRSEPVCGVAVEVLELRGEAGDQDDPPRLLLRALWDDDVPMALEGGA